MAIVATGNLTDRPFGRTLAAVAQRSFSGDLRVSAGGQRYAIGFRDGAVVAAEGKHPADSAVKTAMGAGLITSSQASEILRVLRPDVDDVAVVAERAKLPPEQLARLRRRVVANRAMRLFALEAGEIELDDAPTLDARDVVPIDARVIIYQGARAHVGDERITRELAMLGERFKLTADGDALEGFGFGETEQVVLERLAAHATSPAALVQAMPEHERHTALAVLYAAAVCGLCAIEAAARPAPTRQTVAPPPRAPRPAIDAGPIRALVAERERLIAAGADHFALLGVSPDASPEAVRTAYFDVARQLHPDRITAAGLDDIRADAQHLFASINGAFGILSNPKRRQEYEQTLRAGGEAAVRKQQEEAEAQAARIFAAEEHFRTGEMAMRRNHLEIAVREFTQAVELNPEEAEHHAMLAWATWCVAADKPAATRTARAALDQAARRAPKNPVPWLLLGKIARSTGDDQDAARHFRKVLQLSPDHAEASSELRVVEARLGRPQPSR